MKHEITSALVEFVAGPFLRLRQAELYRAMNLRAESTLPGDIAGATARLLLLAAIWVRVPDGVLAACGAVVGWAALVALIEVAIAFGSRDV